MTTGGDAIVRGMALFERLVQEDEPLRLELEESRLIYFGGHPPARDSAESAARVAAQRHLEWFVLERPSAHLGGVPVEALQNRWHERADPLVRDAAAALLASIAGVFEVTGVDAQQGAWLRDLLGHGEYPVHEPEAAGALNRGDLIVGRVYPLGDSLFGISAAASCFRNPDLLAAVRNDVDAMRASRRGSMRISQAELERMFHGRAGVALAAPAPVPALQPALRAARTLLSEAGLDADDVDAALAELERAPREEHSLAMGSGDALGRVLDRLAFETWVDLERARRVLLDAWIALSHEQRQRAASSASDESAARDVRAALADFDRGREQGRSLEVLFRELERSLGLEEDARDDEQGDEGERARDDGRGDEGEDAPELPSVVPAVVEEFLWEVERERGTSAAAPLVCLRPFGRFAEHVAVFENLGARELLFFAACFAIEEGLVTGADEAHALLAALAEFCRWCEENQELELWTQFEPYHRALSESLPRIAEANRLCTNGRTPSGERLFAIESIEASGAAALVERNRRVEAVVDAALAALLRPGDLVRGELAGARFAPRRCFPAEAAALLGTGD